MDWAQTFIACQFLRLMRSRQARLFLCGVSATLRNSGRWLCITLTATALCGLAVLAHEHLVYHNAIKWAFGYSMFLLPAEVRLGLFTSEFSFGDYHCLRLTKASSASLLEFRPLVRLGTVSYGIYVYHLPILLLLELLPFSRGMTFFVYFVVTVALSEISFRFLETPFLQLEISLDHSNHLP